MQYERRDYFNERFTPDELMQLLDEIGVDVRDVISRRSRAYQTRRDEYEAMSDGELIDAVVNEPTLLRRPIVIAGEASLVGARQSDLEEFLSKATQNEG